MRNEEININFLCRAQKKDDGKWIHGVPAYKYINNEQKWYMYPMEIEINMATICKCVGKAYMNLEVAYEGDIFESQISGDIMILRYGTYHAYCPADRAYMDSVGFYAECRGLLDMPIGDLFKYAIKVGNVYDNPELIDFTKE